MKLGFNIAIVAIVTLICISAVLITALSMGYNGVITTGGVATLAAVPTGLLTFFAAKAKYKSKE